MTGPAAGDRAPDAAVVSPDDGALRLYDLFAEHRHVLLLLGGTEISSTALPRYLERDLAVHRIAARGTAGATLLDRDGTVAAKYGTAPAAYLIRPDGYVGFRCAGSELSTLLPRYLARMFTTPADRL